jgi:hypothetical protein
MKLLGKSFRDVRRVKTIFPTASVKRTLSPAERSFLWTLLAALPPE